VNDFGISTFLHACVSLYLGDTASNLIQPDAIVPGESSYVNLGFFADRRSAYKMFATEGNLLVRKLSRTREVGRETISLASPVELDILI
jgi:hypothetical protein